MYYPANLNILIIILLIITQHKKEIKIFINGLHWEWQLWVGKKKLIKRLDFVYKTLAHQATYIVLSMCLDCAFALPRFFFLRFPFFFFLQAAVVDQVFREQCFRAIFTDPQITLFSNFSLKMGPTTLFTHLKIISLQCFQFQQK